jgi:ABC-type transport system involved in Fe-S cluster assembly fused permease/ATPase subunit
MELNGWVELGLEAWINPSSCPDLTNCDAGSVAPSAAIKIVVVVGSVVIAIVLFFYYHLRKLKAETRRYSRMHEMNAGELKSQGKAQDVIAAISGDFKKLDISFRKIGLTLEDGKSILRSVDGEFQGSSLTAIMGPSGCGKSVRI